MSKVFLAGCLVVASAAAMAQEQRVWVDVLINGKVAMGFAPAADRSSRNTRGVCSQLSEAGGKTKDGLPIRAFDFSGWKEGDAYRVVVFAIVPTGGPVSQTPCSEGGGFKRAEFDSFRVKPGEELTIAKMKDAGLTPWVIRTGLKK